LGCLPLAGRHGGGNNVAALQQLFLPDGFLLQMVFHPPLWNLPMDEFTHYNIFPLDRLALKSDNLARRLNADCYWRSTVTKKDPSFSCTLNRTAKNFPMISILVWAWRDIFTALNAPPSARAMGRRS
jgi:hypothetical protein